LLAIFRGMAAWPIMVRAQQTNWMRRIGVLMAHAETDPEYCDYLAAFWEEFHKFGWMDNRNVQVDIRLDDEEVKLRSGE
jgi:putative tryptophan/tyrosine transport system substrate-binding protein